MNISNEEKLAQLERVMQSRALHNAETLRAFLRFIVAKALEGQEGQLKEYVIATEVFGRNRDFDPRIDSVVRVQAGRLRSKLLEYYATEGKTDPLLIALPKGQYTPVFSLVPSVAVESTVEAIAVPEAKEHRLPANGLQAVLPFWSELLRPPEPVLVVFSNTIFHGSYEEGMKLFNSLNARADHPDAPVLAQGMAGAQAARQPMIDHYTGIGEAMGIYFLGEFFARAQHPFRVKRSLLLTWDDAKLENIVVLGSPAENLFLLELPQRQEFVFGWVKDEHGHDVNAIINTDPQPGEQERYVAKQFGASPSQISEDYALVSLLQGLSDKNRLLILAGINTYGTQAAAEYVTRPEYIKDLIAHLNLALAEETPRLPAFYQILLRVKVNGGVPVQISYVTHHVLNQ
ncbi:MAG: hypothetical protein HYR56_25495 [Acidobacteria bacterium]|nr:hypothetical protein [Acidobacteriota bacterium]MBI3424045.1 hypothetical protein [Acidobacteriota bacterium]